MIYFNFVLFAPPLNNWVFINHQTFYIFSIDLIDSNPNHKFFWSICYIFLYILYSFSLFILTTDLRDRHYGFSLFVREKDTFSPNPVHTTLVDIQAGLMFQLALYLGRATADNGRNSSQRNVIWFTLLPALASKNTFLTIPLTLFLSSFASKYRESTDGFQVSCGILKLQSLNRFLKEDNPQNSFLSRNTHQEVTRVSNNFFVCLFCL